MWLHRILYFALPDFLSSEIAKINLKNCLWEISVHLHSPTLRFLERNENLVLSGNHIHRKQMRINRQVTLNKVTNSLLIFRMWTHLMRGSSPVDWCEDNYTYSPVIAEFFNTVSNALFLVMPPFLMHLHQPYAASIGKGIHLIWFLLIGNVKLFNEFVPVLNTRGRLQTIQLPHSHPHPHPNQLFSRSLIHTHHPQFTPQHAHPHH